MTQEEKICSDAMLLLGEESLSSFKDGTVQAEVSSALFRGVYEAALTETRWHFATRTANLSLLVEEPDNGYSHKFTIPADCLVVNKCSSNPFEIYQEQLYCNDKEIQIEYIYAPPLDACPPFFIKALQYKLASIFAVPISNDEAKTKLFDALALRQFSKARFLDASSRTNTTMGPGSYIRVRR